MTRTQDGWINEYQLKNALWIHDGNPKRPHALLTSGKHSNGFFNSRLVIPDGVLLRDAASDLLELFARQDGDISKVQGVVGPQTGATKLAELLSDQIMADNRGECFWASPAKSETGELKSMVFSNEGRSLLPDQSVLLCEDVLSTGLSVGLTAQAVTEAGGIVLPFVLALVNRSGWTHFGIHKCRTGLMELGSKKIIALINHNMPMWTPEECPLCKQDSEAIRPKNPVEWARLNATY